MCRVEVEAVTIGAVGAPVVGAVVGAVVFLRAAICEEAPVLVTALVDDDTALAGDIVALLGLDLVPKNMLKKLGPADIFDGEAVVVDETNDRVSVGNEMAGETVAGDATFDAVALVECTEFPLDAVAAVVARVVDDEAKDVDVVVDATAAFCRCESLRSARFSTTDAMAPSLPRKSGWEVLMKASSMLMRFCTISTVGLRHFCNRPLTTSITRSRKLW